MQRKVYVMDTPRESDCALLDALDLRLSGMTWREIGEKIGAKGKSMAEKATRVHCADLEESGEPSSEVSRWYL